MALVGFALRPCLNCSRLEKENCVLLMSVDWPNLKKALAESPLGRAVGTAVFDALIAIFSGGFVYEISSNGKLEWGSFYETNSFWFLLVVIISYYFYRKFLYNYEKDILNFADDEYVKAYAMREGLPELLEQTKRRMRNGKEGELTRTMGELEEALNWESD